MRVIAGKHRSRPLSEFKGRDIRPTSDRAKEALFNILQTRISACAFLDLYCGSGGIGIEAISRGAEEVVFVDNSPESAALTKKNLAYLKENAEVELCDALAFVLHSTKKFDVIFLDPPYKSDGKKVVEAIAERKMLVENGVVVYEHCGESAGEITGLRFLSCRKYGITTFDFYENPNERSSEI